MKKALTVLLAVCMLAFAAACAGGSISEPPPPSGASPSSDPGAPSPSPSDTPAASAIEGAQFIDGYWKFDETRKISIEIFERSSAARTDAHDNMYTDWAKAEMLRLSNVEITEYVSMPRWDEQDLIATWLAGNTAPSICYTYNFATIQQYADQDAVWDLEPFINGYRDQLPHMWDLLGEFLLYYARDPGTGQIFWIETLKDATARINTFARADWLKTLNIPEPTTRSEFEDMLIKFRDNAELLLGAEANMMIPFVISTDVGWRSENLAVSFFPPEMSEKDEYILGYDDRHITYPGYKESVRLLNKWYNNDLIWKDFGLYGSGGETSPEEDYLKSGYIGAFIHNWDYPFRGSGTGVNPTIESKFGAGAGFIAIDPIKNEAGITKKFASPSNDRKIFFPKTNGEPMASMLYLDWLSREDTIVYLQLGTEGINYKINDDGTFSTIAIPEGDPNLPYIINSPFGLDQLIVLNEYYSRNPLTALAKAGGGYPGIAPAIIVGAMEKANTNGYTAAYHNFGSIEAESGVGTVLKDKRDSFLTNSIVASIADFDKVYDAGYAEWLATGGQAIIDERTARWAEYNP
jgi:putative aldouronate transport system substrate-binding protein